MANQKKILIVDDDPQVHKMLGTVLIPKNYEIDSALDPKRAWEKIKSSPPDLVILDIMMPGMSGIELCQKIRSEKTTKKPLVLMLSAKDSQHDRLTGLKYGADDYVTKPFDAGELIARVDTHLRIKELYEALQERNRQPWH